MAGIHNALEKGWLSNALVKALGITKPEPGLERFGETLTPIIDLWSLPEWLWLRGEMPWGFQVAQGAVVAENSMAAVTCPNPVGAQQYVVIVEEIVAAANAAAGQVELALQDRIAIAATLAQNPTNGAPSRDTRTSPGFGTLGANTRAETWAGSDPALFSNVIDRLVNVTAFELEPFHVLPFVLKPGTGLVVQNASAVNQSVRATFRGRIRLLQRGELVT